MSNIMYSTFMEQILSVAGPGNAEKNRPTHGPSKGNAHKQWSVEEEEEEEERPWTSHCTLFPDRSFPTSVIKSLLTFSFQKSPLIAPFPISRLILKL